MNEDNGMPCCYKLALAIGITAAIFTFIAGIFAAWFGYGVEIVELYGTIHIGYGPTFLGSIIGAIWVFIETFIFVVIAGWLYCAFAGKCQKGSGSSDQGSDQ
jgi:hypothetical protein